MFKLLPMVWLQNVFCGDRFDAPRGDVLRAEHLNALFNVESSGNRVEEGVPARCVILDKLFDR
jgi:hypothetical protein